MLTIERKSDSRVTKAILHRIADIPGGVTVSVSNLGGSALVEGTPICTGANGVYNVMKTAVVITAYVNGTSIEIAKGSHFKIGDKFADESGSMSAVITAIDKTNVAKDVVTLQAQFSAGLAVGSKLVLCETASIAHEGTAYAQAAADATTINVKKGHNLAIGDYIKGASMTGKQISNIDRGSDLFDVLTLAAATGQIVAADEALTVVTASNGTAVKSFTEITKQAGPAVAIVGSNHDVTANNNLFVDAWVIAVVKESNGPAITDVIKAQLNGIKYV